MKIKKILANLGAFAAWAATVAVGSAFAFGPWQNLLFDLPVWVHQIVGWAMLVGAIAPVLIMLTKKFR